MNGTTAAHSNHQRPLSKGNETPLKFLVVSVLEALLRAYGSRVLQLPVLRAPLRLLRFCNKHCTSQDRESWKRFVHEAAVSSRKLTSYVLNQTGRFWKGRSSARTALAMPLLSRLDSRKVRCSKLLDAQKKHLTSGTQPQSETLRQQRSWRRKRERHRRLSGPCNLLSQSSECVTVSLGRCLSR